MAIADRRDYIRFLYERLSSLRARHFRHALETAVMEGRLSKNVATLTAEGMHLREPTLLPQDAEQGVFEIDFAQMPRLAALLDFLHNALGFTVVADLLAPLLERSAPTKSADEVARALHAALNAWLSNRLESANHILQAQRMRAYLASRGRVAPEAIDDDAIMVFWTTMADASDNERIDGFRLYRSTASAMLRYRAALRDAMTARHLEDALGRGFEPANDEDGIDRGNSHVEPWRSPLRALALPPANRVKWLTAKEQRALFNYLGGAADDEEDTEDPHEPEPDAWRGGLAGEERFDLAFWLTLLRADVFGAVQASIVGRLRKRVEASEAIGQAMAQLDDAAYANSAAGYAALRQQLQLESLAALSVLMEAGAAEAVILLDGLGGPQAVNAIIGREGADREQASTDETVADELSREIEPVLKAAIADPRTVSDVPGRKLLLDAVAATRKVSRAGFRREDRADSDIVVALRRSAATVFEIMRELDRLTAVLSQKAPAGDLTADSARFLATFRRIYCSGA